jgi:hypothetical protein
LKSVDACQLWAGNLDEKISFLSTTIKPEILAQFTVIKGALGSDLQAIISHCFKLEILGVYGSIWDDDEEGHPKIISDLKQIFKQNPLLKTFELSPLRSLQFNKDLWELVLISCLTVRYLVFHVYNVKIWFEIYPKINQITFRTTNKNKGMQLNNKNGSISVEFYNLMPTDILKTLFVEAQLLSFETLNFVTDPENTIITGFLNAQNFIDILSEHKSIKRLHFDNVGCQNINAQDIQLFCIENKRQVDVTIVGVSPFINNI